MTDNDKEYAHLHPVCTGFIAHPNDMSLFQLYEKFYSWDEDIEEFHKGLPLSPLPLKMIDIFLGLVSNKYESFEAYIKAKHKNDGTDYKALLGNLNEVDMGVRDEGY